MSSWDDLRRDARKYEAEIETKLASFSKLGSSYTRIDKSALESNDRMFESMALEIQQLLMKLSHLHDEMAALVGNDPTPSVQHTLRRHREILSDFSQEFNRTKTSIRQNRERADLIGSVQRDINEYHTNGSRQDYYLKENDSIRGAGRLTDDAISIAVSAKEALLAQRSRLTGAKSRLGAVLSRFPAVNSLMQKINLRKRRDAIILACVIAACIILLFLYMR
eukprot:m.29905 g.29905  ORF g.29905 m.29905 type:complete len:222 (+) comp9202_c0_seq2:82-747(+)